MLLCASDCVESSGGGAGARLARQGFVLWRETVCCSVHRPGASWGVKGRSRNRHEDPGIHSHSCSVSLTSSCLSLRWLHVLFSFSSQYPGVAESIHSDINNLMSVLKMSVVLPEGNNYINICLVFVCPPKTSVQRKTADTYSNYSNSCVLKSEAYVYTWKALAVVMFHCWRLKSVFITSCNILNDLIHIHQRK